MGQEERVREARADRNGQREGQQGNEGKAISISLKSQGSKKGLSVNEDPKAEGQKSPGRALGEGSWSGLKEVQEPPRL